MRELFSSCSHETHLQESKIGQSRTGSGIIAAWLAGILIFGVSTPTDADEYKLEANLDSLIILPDAYQKTPEDLEKEFQKGNFESNPYFQWLTKDKDRAIFKRQPASNLEVNLTILNGTVPVEELIIDFQDGQIPRCNHFYFQ